MAIFEGAEPALQLNSVTNSAKQVFQITGTLPSGTVIPAGFSTSTNVTLVNSGTVTVFIGGSTVTTATGVPLAAGAQLTLQGTVVALYGITASGTTLVQAGLASLPSVV